MWPVLLCGQKPGTPCIHRRLAHFTPHNILAQTDLRKPIKPFRACRRLLLCNSGASQRASASAFIKSSLILRSLLRSDIIFGFGFNAPELAPGMVYFQIAFRVNVRRLNRHMAQPHTNRFHIHSRAKQVHSRGMSQAMRADSFGAQSKPLLIKRLNCPIGEGITPHSLLPGTRAPL